MFLTSLKAAGPGLALACLLGLVGGAQAASAQVFSEIRELAPPIGEGAQEASLFPLPDGRVALSWSEPEGKGFAIRTAIGGTGGWSPPRKVAGGRDLFVNWADFPAVAMLGDGTLAVSWLQENGPSYYDYDLKISLSPDAGASWRDPVIPHSDRSQSQHGFVTLLPVADDRMVVLWLDGRAYDPDAEGAAETAFGNAMQLRAAVLDSTGGLTKETLLDARTCTCCQTSAAVTGSGDVLAVYRDRTMAEIRDISIVRLSGGTWSEPETVHADGWEISGCPVNGPAIDARGTRAAVAWFTEADDIARVRVAFSGDSGRSFSPPLQIDGGRPAGRVDTVLLDDGTALVSWLESGSDGLRLMVCRVHPEDGCLAREALSGGDGGAVVNFPRMVRAPGGVYLVWSEPQPGRTGNPDLNVTLRLLQAWL